MGLARGRVDSMQRQGIAWPRRLGAVRVPRQGVAQVRHRDVARARRCETRAVPRVWALARVSCRVILSLKISNATLLKLVFRYNGRREFVEEQARSPPYEQSFGYP